MAECPRCRHRTDQLYPIPSEALAAGGPSAEDRTGRGQPGAGVACRWCVNEIKEG